MFKVETEEQPKMFQVYLNQAWHEVFCYAFAFEALGNRYEDKLLFTIVSGSDSALQSIKGAIDVGSKGGLKFGYGEKNVTDYTFRQEKTLLAEKGKYEKFAMTLNQNRKAIAIVHEDVLNNTKYVLSFDGSPAKDIAQLLGGAGFGLHILPEWEETVLQELVGQNYLNQHELYQDERLFPNGLFLYSINLTEEQADAFISTLIKQGKLKFPTAGQGMKVEATENLTDYLLSFNQLMVEKLSDSVEPTHNPMEHPTLPQFSTYPRELFPVQAHAATAVAKRLTEQKNVLIQGEMSTGKSAVMTAIADGLHALKGKTGYRVCLMCPPSLTAKWPNEIRELLPHAEVHVIAQTEDLIRYHQNWIASGRPKPTKPTFIIISFTTMRNDARTVPGVSYKRLLTKQQRIENKEGYRSGFYCCSCGKPHQTLESKKSVVDEEGNETWELVTHNMSDTEFGSTRRLKGATLPANAFCFHCGDSLWTKKVVNRYNSFKDWTTHEKQLVEAIQSGSTQEVSLIQSSQPIPGSSTGMPRRIAAIEYLRRKMHKHFDISIVDEVHELKGGMTAQGNALGSLVSASKKVVAGTGTLFGGKAEDVYYLLWRMFASDMVESGYQYEEVSRFNEEYGNVEETVVDKLGSNTGEYSNTNSRGGERKSSKKVLPGISPFIFGRYMVQNIINIRLKDVWPDPVELIDTPTIFVDMPEELQSHYRGMISTFEREIDGREDGNRLYPQMMDYGIAYVDNPFNFPSAYMKMSDGKRDLIWEATHINEDVTLPKEAKLQEIVTSELSEGRKAIVYVRDTGSSVSQRDIRPRLKKKLEEIGAKVCILDTSTTKTNQRSEWLKRKIEEEGYDVVIVSQELVKVGLDLLCTPTLIYYQFSWSLFTINQSARRSWRIGQTEECRLFYLSYRDTFQEQMAQIIAMKNRATAAINGEVSSDGLSAMLGDEGDLQSMLIQSVKRGGDILKGSAEEWINQTSDRARELLASIGKKRVKTPIEQFVAWVESEIQGPTTKGVLLREKERLVSNIENELIPGFSIERGVLHVDLLEAFGFERSFVSDGAILFHLEKPQRPTEEAVVEKVATSSSEPVSNVNNVEQKIILFTADKKKKASNKRTKTSDDQLAFDLFG